MNIRMFTFALNNNLKSALLLSALLCIGLCTHLSAEDLNNGSAVTFVPSSSIQIAGEIPSLYIDSLKVDKKIYSLGDTVSGSFKILNQGENDTGDINCLISLVRLDPAGHVASMIYDRRQLGPIHIGAGNSKVISFKYPITFVPQDENLGIHVRAVMKDGTSLAWAVMRVKMSGGAVMMEPQGAFVKLNGKVNLGLQEGPTLKEEDTLEFNLLLKNPGKEKVTLTPYLTLTTKSLKTIMPAEKIKDISIAADATEIIKVRLPSKGMDPETYLAKLVFKDHSGIIRSPFFFARYIIGGDMVTIKSVYAEPKKGHAAGETLHLAVGYNGKPIDILSENPAEDLPVIADLKLKLFNEKREFIAETQVKDAHFRLHGFIQMSAKLDKPASILRAMVVVEKAGREIASFEGPVIADMGGSIVKEETKDERSKLGLDMKYIIGGVVILILIALLVIIRSRKARAVMLILIACAVIADSYGAGVKHPHPVSPADFVYESFSDKNGSANVAVAIQKEIDSGYTLAFFIVAGGPPWAVVPGQTFDVNVTYEAYACVNTPGWVSHWAKINNKDQAQSGVASMPAPVWGTYGTVDYGSGDHSKYTEYMDIYMGTFTTPTLAAGATAFTLNAGFNDHGNGADHYTTGHWEILVFTPPQLISLSAQSVPIGKAAGVWFKPSALKTVDKIRLK